MSKQAERDAFALDAVAPLQADAAAGHPLPESLDAGWLTAVLRANRRICGATRVTHVEQLPIGNGMMASTLRLRLRYDGPTVAAPQTLVAKQPSRHEASRKTSVALGVYRKEVRFYQQIAPVLSHGVQRAIFADVDAQGAQFCLLFDDLAPARPGDQIEGCSLADARAAMDVAATLHAPYWGDTTLDGLSWINRELDVQLYRDAYLRAWPAVCERFAAVLNGDVLAVIEHLSDRIAAYYAQQPQPWTITHQDYRLDNMLFAAAGGRLPLVAVDWQTIRIGPGMSDVSYFIGACADVALRRTWERGLVACYVEALGARGVPDYSFDRAWHDYRRFAADGLITAVAAAALVSPTERGDRMFIALLSRYAQQMIDHQTLSMIL